MHDDAARWSIRIELIDAGVDGPSDVGRGGAVQIGFGVCVHVGEERMRVEERY